VSSGRRIIVGASGSPGSLRALRCARRHLARDLNAPWYPFYAGCRPMVTWPTAALPAGSWAACGPRTPASGSRTR
jgi:hypothetical protein